ncbi:PREDICTED: eukaryotic translation initiation factor 4E-1A-like [Amphimedon queenslandica]|uniref:EIF-4F 25 kDa subunit n=1 Tax=Amphimedon queenslandica TaxID=400682 RepID=A0AAN0IVZ4_AMPQE|nr:PREDICTED: eukaryotic translation initiation factor 4E-1A-like [Amphimedon queenslandica]|eukprot:XP_019848914.1 PREDICTED: eukaryotic translation initiation factor 4E-1A-like [Amphimedon queenslandica]
MATFYFDTLSVVEDFWSVYNHIKRPSQISSGCDYMLFKEGIEPMWEDKTNKDGGRWLLNINKRRRKCGVLDNVWIETLMCLIGEVFDDSSDDICGAMVQNRTKGDKISIWTRVAKNKEHVYRIGHVYKEKIKIHIFEPFTIQYESHLDVVTRSSNRTLFTITCPHVIDRS